MKRPAVFNNKDIWGMPCTGGKSAVVQFQLSCLAAYAQKADIHTLVDLCGGGGKIALTANHPAFMKAFTAVRYNEIEPCLCNLLWLLQSNTRRKWLFDNLYSTITTTTDLRTLFQDALEFTTMELNIKTKEISALSDKEKEMLLSGGLRKNRYMSGLYGAILVYGSARNNRKTMEITGTRPGTVPSLGKQFEFVDDMPEHIGRSKGRWCKAFSTMMGSVYPGLENVQITNCDALDFLRRNNKRNDMLVYIDPPYIHDGREAKEYKHPWTLETHKELTRLCAQSSLKIALCYGKGTQADPDKRYSIIPCEEQECYQALITDSRWYRYPCKKRKRKDEYSPDSSANSIEVMLCNFEIPGVEAGTLYYSDDRCPRAGGEE